VGALAVTAGGAEEAGAETRRAPRPQVPAWGGVEEGGGPARGGASPAASGVPGLSAVRLAAEAEKRAVSLQRVSRTRLCWAAVRKRGGRRRPGGLGGRSPLGSPSGPVCLRGSRASMWGGLQGGRERGKVDSRDTST